MQNSKEKRKTVFLSGMLMVFCITKVLRGLNTFSSVTGGIWNIVSLLFYILLAFQLIERPIKISGLLTCGVTYTVFALSASLINLTDLGISTLYNIIMIPYFLAVIYLFKNRWLFHEICIKMFNLTFFICLIVNAYSIISFRMGRSARPLASDIYYMLTLYPFYMLTHKKEKLFAVVTLFIIIIQFISGKRTGFLALIIAATVYMILSAYVKQKHSIRKTLFAVVAAGVSSGAVYWILMYIDRVFSLGMFLRLERLSSDGGGGRSGIYTIVWNHFKESRIAEKLFGHGNFSTEPLTGFLAHNDYLEVLYDYGIIAFAALAGIMIFLFAYAYRMVREKNPVAPAFAASLVIGLFLSMFSFLMVYFTYVTSIAAFWGICLNKQGMTNLEINLREGQK